jgi:hypothetical protein
MNIRMDRLLRFWIDVEYEKRKAFANDHSKAEMMAVILLEYERSGNAMRYLNGRRRVAWKASPKMIELLADAELEARDDSDDFDV